MLTLGLRRPITSVLLDFSRLHDLPNPDALAEALATAVGRNAVFSRAACVASTGDQKQFCDTLQRMAGRSESVAVFDDEDAALKWLGVEPARP